MTSPNRPESSSSPGSSDIVDVYADQAPPALLRTLQREHIMWMLAFAGLALMGLVIPENPWYLGILRYLCGIGAIGLAAIRAMQSNGIRREIARRNELKTSARRGARRTPEESRSADTKDDSTR